MCLSLPRQAFEGSRCDWTSTRRHHEWESAGRTRLAAGSPTSAGWGTIRASDAERDEVADTLGQHFSEGRLDDTEFRERLDRTFQAVTRADLYTLVADLPPKLAPPIRPRRAEIPALLIVLIVVIALAVETGGLVFPVWLVVLLACWQPWRSSGRRPVPHAHIGSARF